MAKNSDLVWIHIPTFNALDKELTASEHVAYFEALLYEKATGPVPSDLEVVCTIMKLKGVDASSIAQAVLDLFFELKKDGLWHSKNSYITRRRVAPRGKN